MTNKKDVVRNSRIIAIFVKKVAVFMIFMILPALYMYMSIYYKKPHKSDSKVVNDAINDVYNVGPDVGDNITIKKLQKQLVDISKQDETILSKINKLDQDNNSIKGNFDHASCMDAKTDLMDKNNEYRKYLYNLTILERKFLQNEEYSDELTIVKKNIFPNSMDSLIYDLHVYNDLLKRKITKYHSVKICNCNLLDNFLQINKISKEYKVQKTLKNKLKKDIKMLVDYAYSPNMYKQFVK